jgi:hypothetical protein
MQRRDAEFLLELRNDEALFADGFDGCIIGVTEAGPNEVSRVVYDLELMIDVIIERDGGSWEDAWEFLAYNTVGAGMGDSGPLYVWTAQEEESLARDVPAGAGAGVDPAP